jgi:hypothetical protein
MPEGSLIRRDMVAMIVRLDPIGMWSGKNYKDGILGVPGSSGGKLTLRFDIFQNQAG